MSKYLEVLLCTADFWLYYFILAQFLEPKKARIVIKIIVIIAAGLCLYIINQIVFSNSINTAVNTIAFFILVYAEVRLLFCEKRLTLVFWSVFFVIFGVTAEFLAAALIIQAYKDTYIILAADVNIRIQALIITDILFIAGCFLVNQIIRNIRNKSAMSTRTIITQVLLQIILVAILYSTIYFEQWMTSSVFSLYLKYVVYIIIFMINIKIVWDTGKNGERKALETELSIANTMRKAQEKLYGNLDSHIRDIYDTTHDLKYQLKYLKQMNVAGPEIDSIEEKLEAIELPQIEDNRALAVILIDMRSRCERESIRFSYTIKSEFVNNIDFGNTVAIFANLLDNAANACVFVEDADKRYIDLKISENEENLIIYISNSRNKNAHIPKNTAKHGYGKLNAEFAVKDLNGSITINEDDVKYSVIIYIPKQKLQ